MVEVFATNVADREEANRLVHLLQVQFPESRINFDLEDCDKILRVEGRNFIPEKIMSLVIQHGFNCQVLD
jgi:hypothetical protein